MKHSIKLVTKSLILCLIGTAAAYSAPISEMRQIIGSPLQLASSQGVKGPNVNEVFFNGGSFVQEGNNRWSELGQNGARRFDFVEQARDEWSVYLRDNSRGVNIQLDLFRKKVVYSDDSGKKFDLYMIEDAFTGQH
ncbi:hypothetical protein [uncultured Litoreibacter sp.]|uniref:hypothetical protein n=2 Tax=uncultured Litoreibacter sp. TaxID=1392394 RepID=UPI0026077ADA|nr:hypothetical protein [uncultured Litoreibacter sp.]